MDRNPDPVLTLQNRPGHRRVAAIAGQVPGVSIKDSERERTTSLRPNDADSIHANSNFSPGVS